MGLIDHLWDDTVAGPRPDSGPSDLPRFPSTPPPAAAAGVLATRNLTILRPSAAASGGDSGSEPSSPLTPTTPRGDWRRLRRRLAAEGWEPAEPRSPTVYDWVVISALDR